MKSKILLSINELNIFSDRFFENSGIKVNLDYLQQGRVRAFYSDTGQMVGGFVLNGRKPFRYLSRDFVTDVHRQSPILPNLDETAEITCIWVAKQTNFYDRNMVGYRLVKDCMSSDKRYFMGGSFNKKIMRLQKKALPNDIFEINFIDKISGEPGIHYFYYGTKYSLLTGLPRWVFSKLAKNLVVNLPFNKPKKFKGLEAAIYPSITYQSPNGLLKSAANIQSIQNNQTKSEYIK